LPRLGIIAAAGLLLKIHWLRFSNSTKNLDVLGCDSMMLWNQGSIYWKIPPPRGGGNKYGLMGKKYHENNARAPTKKEKKKERTREKKR